MRDLLEHADLEVAGLHVFLFAVGGVLLAMPTLTTFHAMWIFVVAYNAFVPVYFHARGLDGITDLWLFLAPLSVLMVVPDWFLCTELGTLRFPGAPGPAPVPGYMAGLWVPPLFAATYIGSRTARFRAKGRAFAAAAATGLVLFVAGEAILTELRVWEALGVRTTEGVAWYILGPEVLLSVATLYAYRETANRSVPRRLAAAGIVMLLYLGAAAASYLVLERALPAAL